MAPTSTLFTLSVCCLFPPCELPWPSPRWTVCLQFCGWWIYADLWDGYLIHPSYQSEGSQGINIQKHVSTQGCEVCPALTRGRSITLDQ